MKNIKALKKDLEIASEKKEKALNNIADLGQKLNPLNTESKYITCRKCGSHLSVEYMRKNTRAFVISRLRCPICYSDTSLYCETSNKRLEAAQHKYMNAEKQEQICKNALDSMLDSMLKNAPAKKQVSTNDVIDNAIKEVEERLEIIYSEHKTPDYVEIKGEIGGDMICYRVYNDGSIYEK